MLPTNRPPTHPGEMLLKDFLEPLGVSQVEAAKRMNIPFQRLNAIVKGRRGVSADTALLLEALTRWDAQIWLTLQAKWDLWHALRARGQRCQAVCFCRSRGTDSRNRGGLAVDNSAELTRTGRPAVEEPKPRSP